MRILRHAAVAIAAFGMVLASSAPASAALSGSCTDRGHNMNFWAYYSDAGSAHQWTEFQYELGGGTTGGESNANFWLYEAGNVVYWNKSPDTLVNSHLYSVTPPWQVYTSAAAQEWVLFQGIFDVFGPDPVCSSQTATI